MTGLKTNFLDNERCPLCQLPDVGFHLHTCIRDRAPQYYDEGQVKEFKALWNNTNNYEEARHLLKIYLMSQSDPTHARNEDENKT